MSSLFSSITSQDLAKAACTDGKLVKILLFPEEFGGEDIPQNVVYVPPFAKLAKENSLISLTAAIEQGMTAVSITPEYKGDSFVPSKIVTTASYPDAPSPGYRFELNIW